MAGRVGAVLLAAMAPVVILTVDPAGWFPFGPVKWLAVSGLILAGSALVLTTGTIRLAPWPTAAAGGLVVAMAAAAIVGLDPRYAWTGTPERHLGVVFWVLCALALVAGQVVAAPSPRAPTNAMAPVKEVGSEPHPGPIGRGLVAAGLGLGLAATAESLGWEPSVFDVGSRLTATLGSSAYLGAASALLLPVLAGISLDRRLGRTLRAAAAVGAPSLAVALVGSGARAAWFGTGVALLAVAAARRRTWLDRPQLAAVGVGAAAVLLLAIAAVTPAGARLMSLGDRGAPGGAARVDEWRVATRVLVAHPVTGVGPEGYRIAFGEHVDAAYERDHGRDPLPDRAHSGPLDVALAGGPLGLVAWMAFLVLVGQVLWRSLRDGRPWLAGAAAGLVAHWVGQLFLFPLAELEPIAWLLAGVVLVASARRDDLRRFDVPRAVPMTVGLVAVVALVAGGLGVAADRRADAAATHLGSGLARARTAERAAEDAVTLRPDVVRTRLLLARTRLDAGRGYRSALVEVDRAARLSPGDPVVRLTRLRYLVEWAAATQVPAHAEAAWTASVELLAQDPVRADAWWLRGRAAVLAGRDTDAERSLRRAASLAPREPGALLDLAVLLALEGRADEARVVLEQAERRSPDDARLVAARRAVADAGG